MNDAAVFSGSFDPVTYGHIDLFERFEKLNKKVIVLVSFSTAKKYLFSLEERIQLLKECTKDFSYIQVESFEGLTVNYMKKNNISLLLRGVRSTHDFEYEKDLHFSQKALMDSVDTLFFMTSPKWSHLRSSWIKEIAQNNGELKSFFPEFVKQAVEKKIKNGDL